MKNLNRFISGMALASLIFAGSVLAGQQTKQTDTTGTTATQTVSTAAAPGGMGPGKRHNGPVEMLGRFQFENMAAQTISELSSQSLETVTARLKEERLPKVLKEYSITRDAFQAAMKPKFISLVHKRVEDGSITSAQEALILEELEKQGTRHATMEKLIQNGVTAGIISQAEANKMLAMGEEEPPAE